MSGRRRATACSRRCWRKKGMTANDGALEHPQGFFAVYNGAGNFNADRLLEHWGDPFDLVDPGIAFKRHPCCGSTHPAVDAMLLYARSARPRAGACREGGILDASASARAHQPARSAERPRRQILDPIRARARAHARHRQHGAFQRRGRARSGDARADGARACGARSGGEAARPATTSIAGSRSRPPPARASSISSIVRSAATAIIRCRRARWRRNSATARRRCSTRKRSKRLLDRCLALETVADVSRRARRHRGPASRRRRSHRAAAPMHDVSKIDKETNVSH